MSESEKTELIRLISSKCKTKNGEELIRFLDTYNLKGLREATLEQLEEFVANNYPSKKPNEGREQ